VTSPAGPLCAAIEVSGDTLGFPEGPELGTDANARIVMHRVALVDPSTGRMPDKAGRPLLRWACSANLGQDQPLLDPVWKRRNAVLDAFRSRHFTVRRFRVSPQWRLAVGLGDRLNPSEIGLSLHGTYGWPIIPGSTLKGATCAWAVGNHESARQIADILGAPRPKAAPNATETSASYAQTEPYDLPAARGSVTFLDAIPAGSPVEIARDVLTPHVKPYYRSTAPGAPGEPVPPGEWHNPEPFEFLVVSGGTFAVDLVGRDERRSTRRPNGAEPRLTTSASAPRPHQGTAT
jgi:CRISPR type III-B/RAMP module RAMP protein Cmr6